MTRPLPIIFGQKDYSQLLGFSPTLTIADAGCYLTSFAMIARYYGKETDPVALNEQLKAKGLYAPESGLMVSDAVLSQIYPDIPYQESLNYPGPADLGVLKNLLNDPTLSVILEIDLGGGYTHFVVCVGVNGVVKIANPWTKQIEDFATNYGDPVVAIIKYVVYKGTPVSVDSDAITQLQSQVDANWQLYQNQITATKQVQDQMAELQKQLNDLQTTITGLKTEVSQVTQSNANLAGELQKKNEEDATAIDEGMKAEKDLVDYKNYLHAIASSLKIDYKQIEDKDVAELILTKISTMKAPPPPPDPIIAVVEQVVSSAKKNSILQRFSTRVMNFIFIQK